MEIVARNVMVLPSIFANLKSLPGFPSEVKITISKKHEIPTIISIYLSIL